MRHILYFEKHARHIYYAGKPVSKDRSKDIQKEIWSKEEEEEEMYKLIDYVK
jgi:hypothetical protein